MANFYSYSRVAQVVEQVTVNHRVGGSSPSSGAVRKGMVIRVLVEGPGLERSGPSSRQQSPSNHGIPFRQRDIPGRNVCGARKLVRRYLNASRSSGTEISPT